MSKREKVFGAGRPLPLDRNAKAKLKILARALTRRTEPGKHYGPLTAKGLEVFEALLYRFHNAKSGLCFPSIERIAEAAACCPETVRKALRMLEAAGLLTWVNRLVRRREHDPEACAWRWRVLRTSNAYRFRDLSPQRPASSAKIWRGTDNQVFSLRYDDALSGPETPPSPVEAALRRLGETLKGYTQVTESSS